MTKDQETKESFRPSKERRPSDERLRNVGDEILSQEANVESGESSRTNPGSTEASRPNVRPPIVVVLGHVDHGKTKILDFIRQTKVAEGEAGGITQHIGAYQIEYSPSSQGSSGPKMITFLDTPGHEAFSAIRSRGAKVADLAILVVAADEGVKNQTKEAIRIIEETKTPVIVAINKIDKENANPNKVKQELSENGIFLEDWGGKVPGVEVSAKTGQGIDALLDMILLVAEMEELKAEPGPAQGIVIDSHLDSRKGHLATLLLHDGVLKANDWLVVGGEAMRVKSLASFKGDNLSEAYPSQPVVVLGWSTPPSLGEPFQMVGSRAEALALSEKQAQLGKPPLFVQESGPEKSQIKTLNLVVKTDVASSLEAIDQILKTIKSEEVAYRVVDYGVGGITDGDLKKALATKALVVGFRVAFSAALQQIAERDGVVVMASDIIYELLEEIKKKMSGLLDQEIKRIPLGRLKVLALFKKEGKSQIVGGRVLSGKIKRGAMVEVFRSSAVVAIGKLGQLQAQKTEATEVAEGAEAGVRFDFLTKNITPLMYIREGDLLEVYEEEKIFHSL